VATEFAGLVDARLWKATQFIISRWSTFRIFRRFCV